MDIIQHFEMPELLILLGVGLAVLLFGYRIKKVAFFIIWFLLGYLGVSNLMPWITEMVPEIGDNTIFEFLLPIGGGLLLALLGFTIEKLCVGGITFVLTILIATQYFGTEIQTLAISAVVGVILAALAVALMKPATIIATSAAGAYAITLALLGLFTEISLSEYYWPIIIGLTILGSLFQLATTKHVR